MLRSICDKFNKWDFFSTAIEKETKIICHTLIEIFSIIIKKIVFGVYMQIQSYNINLRHNLFLRYLLHFSQSSQHVYFIHLPSSGKWIFVWTFFFLLRFVHKKLEVENWKLSAMEGVSIWRIDLCWGYYRFCWQNWHSFGMCGMCLGIGMGKNCIG